MYQFVFIPVDILSELFGVSSRYHQNYKDIYSKTKQELNKDMIVSDIAIDV